MQADALEIETGAKRRLADQDNAAQDRGEVATARPKSIPGGNTSAIVSDLGLTSKDIHEARIIRDAEVAQSPDRVVEQSRKFAAFLGVGLGRAAGAALLSLVALPELEAELLGAVTPQRPPNQRAH